MTVQEVLKFDVYQVLHFDLFNECVGVVFYTTQTIEEVREKSEEDRCQFPTASSFYVRTLK